MRVSSCVAKQLSSLFLRVHNSNLCQRPQAIISWGWSTIRRRLASRGSCCDERGDYGVKRRPLLTIHFARRRLAIAQDTKITLPMMTNVEAELIGRGFASALMTNLTCEAAVDEWILRYPGLKELDKKEPWFRPLIERIGKRLLAKVSWGLKFRVSIGAGLSVMDLISDIFMAVLYLKSQETTSYGYITLGLLAANILLQTFISRAQHANSSWKVQIREYLFAMTGIKPAVDAFNVGSGKQQRKDEAFDSKTELVLTRSSELFLEAIPGTVLQIYVLVNSSVR